jgi:hypothetical protein
MNDDEPHAIEDNEPAGQATVTRSTVTVRKKKKQKLVVAVDFDDNLKEFQLWDYLYDVKTEYFQLDALPDYKNRIQYYEIKADRSALRKLRLWLMKNNFKYKLDKS